MKKHIGKKKNVRLVLKKNRNLIYSGVIGLAVGILVTLSFFPERIAVLADGTQVVATTSKGNITADDLYENMKNEYAISTLLNDIDEQLLKSIYSITEEMQTEIDETAEYYIDMYNTYYGYSEEDFLASNGFETKDDFIKYLEIDYLRNIYFEKYLIEQVSDKDIEKFYKDNVYGAIETKYIAVNEEVEDAESLIKEILAKVKDGSTYDELIEKYEDSVEYQDLEYQNWNSDLDTTYLAVLTNLKDNSYSKEYVTTNYGYTIVFRGKQKEKNSLEDEKDAIVEVLTAQLQKDDENIYYKALIEMRKEYNLEIHDTDLKRRYAAYCKQFD